MAQKPNFDVRQLEADLKQALAGEVRFDQMYRMLYSTDASNYQIAPIGVVLPRHADDVVAVHSIAAQHGVPLLPRGAGSSLAGQTVGYAVVMDLSRYMNNVISIDPAAKTVRCQPGIALSHLNDAVAPHGLMLGPDPASGDRATVGGGIGNNSTGTHSILYGMFDDHVHAVNAVLANGTRCEFGTSAPASDTHTRLAQVVREALITHADEIQRRFPKTFRTCAGYPLNKLDAEALNLARLFVGSEGTLGTVVEATVGLVDRPIQTRLALLHYDSLRAALEDVPGILEVKPSAVELLDKMLMDMTRAHPDFSKLLTFVEGDPQAVLMVEFYGESDAELSAHIDRLKQHMAGQGFTGTIVLATTPQQIGNVMKVRKAGLGLLMSIRGELKPIPFIEDAAVPVPRVADYVLGVQDIVADNGATMALYAHASAGCIHIRPLLNLKTVEDLRQYRAIAEAATDLVLTYDGTTSGEHGEGLARGEFSEQLFGAELVEAFRTIKRAFDPQGLMNPGKVIDVGPMDDPSILRYGTGYTVRFPLKNPRFDWSADHGFAAAVEMCNGAGVCRKEGTGVMCPSYMATRDESASTRGRANALRLAMSGQLNDSGLEDERVYDVLALCLSCKACKAECPSRVDVARLKAEFTAAYYDEHGVPLRSWIFGHIHRLNRLGSLLPDVSNMMLKSPLAKWVFGRIGVTQARDFPLFAPQRFSRWYARDYVRRERTERKPAPILIADTYTEYNFPQLGRAALKVADAAGFDVKVWGRREIDCCGRPLISKGLLDDARWLATRNVQRMSAYVARGERFMLIEPSCAATFRDEYPDLVPARLRTMARNVAGAVITVEEWLAEAADQGALDNVQFDDTPCEVVLHGHCYQRSLWGTGAAQRALGLLPNCTVNELDDGCCGVAGSFGYEAEHYDVSVKIGEQRLLPAVREAQDAIIVASGVSCREQIEHGAGRRALHPIELIASKLRDD